MGQFLPQLEPTPEIDLNFLLACKKVPGHFSSHGVRWGLGGGLGSCQLIVNNVFSVLSIIVVQWLNIGLT
jgi:hypothetical protein